MNRWGLFISDGAIHRDWRSLHQATSSSPFGLGRGEMVGKINEEVKERLWEYLQRQRDLRALTRKAQTKLVRVTDFGTALPGEDIKGLVPELPEASRLAEEQ